MDKVWFFGKIDDERTKRALDYCKLHFDTESWLGGWNSRPPWTRAWKGRINLNCTEFRTKERPRFIISYLSRWVFPEWLLNLSVNGAINFHPGPPEYPGYAPNNFALYDKAYDYGVTCHFMNPLVDSGTIIKVKRFQIHPNDTVLSLLERAHDYQLVLFYETIQQIGQSNQNPVDSDLRWGVRKTTKKDLEELFNITPDMSKDEIERRIRATSYGEYQPYIELAGRKWMLSE